MATKQSVARNVGKDVFADWIPKGQAAELLQISERTLERMAAAGQIEQAYRRVPGRRPLAVLKPEDVERLGRETVQPLQPAAANALVRVPGALAARKTDFWSLLAEKLAMLGTQYPSDPKPWLTIPEASAATGLSKAYLRRKIRSGELPAIRDRATKVKRVDLEKL